MSTKIEWADETWNPIRGCSPMSAGCDHCWARRMALRHEGVTSLPHLHGFVDRSTGNWTGKVALIESELEKPLHWRKPRKIAVGLMGDLWHPSLMLGDIARIYSIFARCPHHTFLTLTKRPGRRAGTFSLWKFNNFIERAFDGAGKNCEGTWPLPNVHEGVSVEDQKTLDERVPWLLRTPAAKRWLSLEPLLGPVDIGKGIHRCHAGKDGECTWDHCPQTRDGEPEKSGRHCPYDDCSFDDETRTPRLDHVVLGGESGPGARPCHPDWVRQVRDQCVAAGVPFLFKQWGEYCPESQIPIDVYNKMFAGGGEAKHSDDTTFHRIGKRAAGRLLDGRTWDQTLEVTK